MSERDINIEKLIKLFKKYGFLPRISKITGIPSQQLRKILIDHFGMGLFEIRKKLSEGKIYRRNGFGKNTAPYYNVDIKKIVKLFKKYGFIPKVSKIIGIPPYNLRNILIDHFGVGMRELRNKIAPRKSYIKKRAMEKNCVRYQQVKELYDKLGTLEKVGKELNLTKERIRQILKEGSKFGFFDYRPIGEQFEKLKKALTREDLIKEIKSLNSKAKLSSKFNINVKELTLLLKYFNIELEEYRKAVRMGRYMQEYSKIVDDLGHHPATTEMNKRSSWRAIWGGIDRYWGNMDNFRKEFGIEKPNYNLHPNTLTAWKQFIERKKSIKKEKKVKVLDIIRNEGPISAISVSRKIDVKRGMVLNYINELLEENLILKTGSGRNIAYIANTV